MRDNADSDNGIVHTADQSGMDGIALGRGKEMDEALKQALEWLWNIQEKHEKAEIAFLDHIAFAPARDQAEILLDEETKMLWDELEMARNAMNVAQARVERLKRSMPLMPAKEIDDKECKTWREE